MTEIFENIPQPDKVQETPEIHELVDISCCDTSFIQKTPLNLLHKRVLDSLNVDNSNNKKCNIEKYSKKLHKSEELFLVHSQYYRRSRSRQLRILTQLTLSNKWIKNYLSTIPI